MFKQKNIKAKLSGFHLFEIFLGVVALAILVSLVFFVINPSYQLSQSRNTQRKKDIIQIIKALHVYKYQTGTLPQTISSAPQEICRLNAPHCQNLVDLSALSKANIVSSLPVDADHASQNGIGYTLFKQQNGKVVISAPGAENGTIIEQSY